MFSYANINREYHVLVFNMAIENFIDRMGEEEKNKMLSYVLEGGKLREVYSEVPRPKEGEILVKMKAVGLCGTDVEKICGQYTTTPYLGHEVSGVVVESRSREFREGDRVFPHVHTPCYDCEYCVKGSETMCPHYRSTNIYPGGFSEYFIVPEWNVRKGGVIRLPYDVSYEEGALIEPLSTVVRGLSRVNIEPGYTVLIIGAGPIGLLHLMTVKAMGADVIVSNSRGFRLDYAKRLGANHVIPSDEHVPRVVREINDGKGADLVIVASGSPSAITTGLKSVRRGGKVLLFAAPYKGTKLDYDLAELFNREVSIVLSNSADDRDTRRALYLIRRRKVDVTKIVTQRYHLREFRKLLQDVKERKVIKAMVLGN
ncbi:L-threonine 3-dehydrogenase [Sulfuracidifex tepidarius]|uniref:L-threonine 3-dehydrogenase n=2 Tax=Sulfuracidifex tepidarius TaxID=1294262 RepID=A0A510DT06_9CREN|nr:L-threonine 3-dehydrogenase [Sulfuracidifex tepidarius]